MVENVSLAPPTHPLSLKIYKAYTLPDQTQTFFPTRRCSSRAQASVSVKKFAVASVDG